MAKIRNLSVAALAASLFVVGDVLAAPSRHGGRTGTAKVALTSSQGEAETIKMTGRGVGTDKSEALKDAYRDAIERAVGLYVDAEQMVKNEALVSDQILTQSNAYIERYDVVKETNKLNGLVEVQIVAEVKKRALAAKLDALMPEKKYALSEGLKDVHAQMTTVEKRNVDGAALLEKTLKEIGNPFLKSIDCSLASPEAVVGRIDQRRVDNADSGNVLVNYLFRFGIDRERFFESVATRLKETLDQISLSEPKDVAIQATARSRCDVAEAVEYARSAAEEGSSAKGAAAKRAVDNLMRGQCDDAYDVVMPQLSPSGRPAKGRTATWKVLLVTGMNKYSTVYNGRIYEIDADSGKMLQDWLLHMRKSCSFKVCFLDAEGEVVAVQECAFSVSNCSEKVYGVVVILPWFKGSFYRTSGVLGAYRWESFNMPRDILPNIKDMKIELAE